MSEFDVIEFGYNAADETINFGTRCLGDENNLYEATTVACFKYSEPQEFRADPFINATVQDSQVFFSLNKTIRIFEDKQCSDVVFNAEFEAVIDTFCWYPQKKFLLICRRDGLVNIVDCGNNYVSVHTITCDPEETTDRYFINSFLDNGCFLIVTKKGRVYKLECSPDFKIECLHEFNFKVEIACYQHPFLIVNGTKMGILDLENKNCVLDQGLQLKRIFPLPHMFLVLDCDGKLAAISAKTLLVFSINDSEFYKDLLVLTENDHVQVLVLVEEMNGDKHIQLLSYEGFTKICSLKVTNEIQLIPMDTLHDELLYISKIGSDNNISEIRLHVMTETLPEQRFQRLLKKRKFDEAKKFARQFGLDTTLITKAQAEEISEKNICTSQDIDNLINFLNVIDDDEFKLQCCLTVESSCDTFEDSRKILTYGSTLHLKKQENKIITEDMQKSLTHLLFRLDTFLDVNEQPKKVILSWSQFSGCDLIEETTSLLRNLEIEKAQIVYSRLDESTAERLTEKHVSKILTVLDNISLATIEPFMPVFITVTLSILPLTLSLFVKWSYKKVFYLEKWRKTDFPNNAIEFCENMVRLMRLGDVADHSFKKRQESMVELSSLFETLKTLQNLKDKYWISIPVEEYLAGPQNVVRFLLNIEMPPKEYDIFLKQFLCKYMVENQMEPNEILLTEINDLMKYENCSWTNISLILTCITSVSVKLAAIKSILDCANVPWCDIIKKIANEALEYPPELTGEIKTLIQNEPVLVVLRRPQYKIKNKNIRNVDEMRSIVNKILRCNEQTKVDDILTVCNSPEFRHEGNILLIKWFIVNGLADQALTILDNNTPEEIFNCAKDLTMFIEMIINNEVELPPEHAKNYYNLSQSIFKRLNDHDNENWLSYNEQTLSLIRNVHDLTQNFNIKTQTYALLNTTHKNKIVNDALENARQAFETDKQTIDEVFATCKMLSVSLGLDVNEVLLKFCEKCNDYNVIIRVAQRVCDFGTSIENLCWVAILLVKYVGTLQVLDNSRFDDSDESLETERVTDDETFYNGFLLAQHVIAKAVEQSESDLEVLEVSRWINLLFYLINQKTELERKLFGDIYDSGSVMPGFLTFSTIRNIFVGFCGYAKLKNPNGGYLQRFMNSAENEDDFIQELKLLPSVLENMIKEGQQFTAYKIIETVVSSLVLFPEPDETILSFLMDLLKKQCVPKLLHSVLGNKTIDDDFAFSLLLLCDRDEGAKFIVNCCRMYKRHPRKFECISKITLKFWDHYELTTGRKEMAISLLNIKWWKRFESKKIEYDNFFKMKPGIRLEFLINANCLDIQTMKEYCKDFNLAEDGVYKYSFKKVFVNWKPDFEIRTEGNQKYLVVKNTEVDLLAKAYETMEHIDSNCALEAILNTWNSINTYYYEVFIAMLQILAVLDPGSDKNAQLTMLWFLKDYQRVSKPTETEIEQWYTNFPDSQSVDPLSEFRLSFTPFLFTKQIIDIIRPELNLKTYKLWFHASETLPILSKDQICSFVVKGIVSSGVLLKNVTENWVLHAKHEDLFKEIDECVKHISNLELTTSVVYHLVMNCPKGADQVAAAKLCYKYALQYREKYPDSGDVEKAVTKVEKKYFTYAAKHILHTHQLVEETYMHLLNQPKELICALYMSERILKSSDSFQCQEVNKAAEGLAALFNLDIKKIRHTLISNYLCGEQPMPLNFDSSFLYPTENYNEDEHLNAIAYICCSDDVQHWRTCLLEIGGGGDSEEQRSVHSKTKALKVFAMISDVETIMSITELSYDEFRNYIDKVTVVSNLLHLGISLNVNSLDHTNKKELLSRLAKCTRDTLAVKTMALMCITYNIYDMKYWEFIINSSIKYSLFAELRSYVHYLKKFKFLYKKFYINAWQQLIDNCFTNLNVDLVDKELVAKFLMIQSCPVLHCLNLENSFKKCIARNKPEFAAVLLQYLDVKKRPEFIEQVRNSNTDLSSSLNNLKRNGLCGISYVKKILAL